MLARRLNAGTAVASVGNQMTSRQWWVVAVLVSLGSVASAAGARPAGTEDGTPAGTVLWVRGDAQVKPKKGAAFTPALDAPLYRSDEIIAPSRGFVLVELSNGYLARIDEEINLGVAEIALIDAAAASDTRETQLKRLLSSAEYSSIGQRVAAARAGKSGAESVAPKATRAEPAETERRKDKSEEARPAESAPRPAPAPASQPPPPPMPDLAPIERRTQAGALGGATKGGGSGGAGDDFKSLESNVGGTKAKQDKASRSSPAKAAPAEAAAPVRWFLLQGKNEERQAGALPAALAAELPALSACLANDPPPSPAAAPLWRRLLLRVEGGKVTAVRRGGGLAAPGCAEALVGKAVPAVAGLRWLVLEVP